MLRKQTGFTLIELIMVIIIIGVMSVVIGRIMLQGFRSFATSQNITEADWQALVALQRLTSDIHNIRSAADISVIGSSQLNFVDVNGTNVQYSVSSGSLLRNSQTLATGVTAFTLGYLDKTGVTTATLSSVRYISISLTETQGTLVTSFSTLVGTRGMI